MNSQSLVSLEHSQGSQYPKQSENSEEAKINLRAGERYIHCDREQRENHNEEIHNIPTISHITMFSVYDKPIKNHIYCEFKSEKTSHDIVENFKHSLLQTNLWIQWIVKSKEYSRQNNERKDYIVIVLVCDNFVIKLP